MNSIKFISPFFVVFGMAFSFHLSAQAWIFGTSKVKDGPPKQYCVSPGWFNNNPYKCVPYDQAEKLDKDYSSVYAAASSRSTDMYALAQKDISQGKANLSKLEESLAMWQGKVDEAKRRLTNGETLRPDERLGSEAQVKAFETERLKVKSQVDAAKLSLGEKENGNSGQQLAAGSQRLEIARKGLLTQVSDMENRLSTFESNLENTAQELNNTILEAFVVAKIARLAESFCAAKTMCDKDGGKGAAEVKKFLLDKVASEKLRTSFNDKSVPGATAPAEGAK